MVCGVLSSLFCPIMLSSQKHLLNLYLVYRVLAFSRADAGLAMAELPSKNASEFMATKSSSETTQQTWMTTFWKHAKPVVAKITLCKLSLYSHPYFLVTI